MAIQFTALEAVFEANAKPFQKATEECQQSSSSFLGTLSKIAAAITAAFSVYKIEQFVKGSLVAFAEYERAIAPLSFQLENWVTGLKQFQFWGEQIATTTIYTKELALEMASLSMTMGVNQSDARQFTRLALDLASALKIDVHTAVRLLADAYDGNTEALMRYSIALTTTKDGLVTIETLEKDLAHLHGQSAAEVRTLYGTYGQLVKQWNDYKEAIGEGLAPFAIKAMNIFRGLMYSMELDIGRGKSIWQSFLDTANLAMDGVFGKVGADRIREYWRELKQGAEVAEVVVVKTWKDIRDAINQAVDDWLTGFRLIRNEYEKFMAGKGGFWSEQNPLYKWGVGEMPGGTSSENIESVGTQSVFRQLGSEGTPYINKETMGGQKVANIILNMNQQPMTQIDPRLVAAIVAALKQYGWAVTSPTQNVSEITAGMQWQLGI
jgi:hypothetical protein